MRTALTPLAAPTVVGRYTAAQDGSSLIDEIRFALNKAATAATRIAVFACDDSTIASGDITGTFDSSDPTTWPNGGAGVQLLGVIGGGPVVPGAPPANLLVVPAEQWGPYFIVCRVLGTSAQNVNISGIPNPQVILTPLAAPTVEGRYTAAQDGTSLIEDVRFALNKAATAATRIAVFACDDSTIASGDITGTFDSSDPTTWPNGGAMVQLLGVIGGGPTTPGTPPGNVLEIPASRWSPYFIVLRVLGTSAQNVNISGVSTQASGASQTATGNSLAQRTAAGALAAIAMLLGAVGATLPPSGLIRVPRAAAAVLSSVLVDGTTASPMISTDGADGILINGSGAIRIGDDAVARLVSLGNGEIGSRFTLTAGQATSSIAMVSGAILNIGTDNNDHDIAIGANFAGNLLTIRAGTEGMTLTTTGIGPLILTGGSGATNAFLVTDGGTLTLGNNGAACTVNMGGTGGIKTLKIGDEAVFVNVVTICGAASTLGFFGHAAVARPAAYTLSWGAASRTLANTTISGFVGQDNSDTNPTYAKVADLNTLVTQVTSLSSVVKQIALDFQGYGLLQ